jgi:ketosteroid isomerase-like protein
VCGVTASTDDREAIRDLYARYCLYLDTGAVAEWAALYAEDGEFHTDDDHIVGREALEDYGARLNPGSVHRMVLNHVIDVEGDAATCRASVLLTSGTAIASVGRTTDELRRSHGAWRIARRVFVADGR